MAKRVDVHLVDDTDPTAFADETVTFGLDGVDYEIDLTGANAEALRQGLRSWITHARRVARARGGTRGRKA
jgi:hypothetical protein